MNYKYIVNVNDGYGCMQYQRGFIPSRQDYNNLIMGILLYVYYFDHNL